MTVIILFIIVGMIYVFSVGAPVVLGYYGIKFFIRYFSNKNKFLENNLKRQAKNLK